MSLNSSPPHNEIVQPRKLRLNAEQWQTLQALAEGIGNPGPSAQVTAIGRLTSHGLVATDPSGCPYLTLFGMQRLDQGR
ncbi:hypothetical protein [Variovorax sp. OV329]|uniref:hypothetical protein n=1 Tax=Variovorax sp. OV329 TaxID=1882825 RepID=UPI0008EF7569|nr:hypothetical protein [Variovorax sp. OV329]SFL96755.1 hypothetical protein SAMN05444747_101504 [Variovorax sp. OV329]